jgi:hypothetical protein
MDVGGIRFGNTTLVSSPTGSLGPQVFDRTAAEADPEVASAMTPSQFIAAAETATKAVGAPFGAPVALQPDSTARWDE